VEVWNLTLQAEETTNHVERTTILRPATPKTRVPEAETEIGV